MDLFSLSRIDDELDSSEVAALCFLCRDILNKKHLETIHSGKNLFQRLDDKGRLNNGFLCHLLKTIRRADLLALLKADSRYLEESSEADARPILSDYRVMLYQLHEDMTEETLDKLKFFLMADLGRRKIENCKTALDVFSAMENTGLLTSTNMDKLHRAFEDCDHQLASHVQSYLDGNSCIQIPPDPVPHLTLVYQRDPPARPPLRPSLSITETQQNLESRESLYSDAHPTTQHKPNLDMADYYSLNSIPRGICMIISNENFFGSGFRNRPGTEEDEKSLSAVFTQLGFTVELHRDLRADEIKTKLHELSRQSFLRHDAVVVCVLTHGESGCVFGVDGEEVSLRDVTRPFTGGKAQTLAGKPKLFFIQACQGQDSQRGAPICLPTMIEKTEDKPKLEEDAGPICGETVPVDADFLVGMATVAECKSFRNTTTGSIYIQELCKQLRRAAESQEDILTVLTRVNREVSKGVYLRSKQMPEPKYTLTKKLILTFVKR